jgi:hypothetical protein
MDGKKPDKKEVLDGMAVQYGYEEIPEEEKKEEEEKNWMQQLHELAEQRRKQQLTEVTK